MHDTNPEQGSSAFRDGRSARPNVCTIEDLTLVTNANRVLVMQDDREIGTVTTEALLQLADD